MKTNGRQSKSPRLWPCHLPAKKKSKALRFHYDSLKVIATQFSENVTKFSRPRYEFEVVSHLSQIFVLLYSR